MNERLNHLDHLSDTTPPGPPVTFERAGGPKMRSVKVACIVCGRRGYPSGTWQDSCRRGHRACRNGCGRLMSVFPNGAARRHASHRCPATDPNVKWPLGARNIERDKACKA